MAKQRYNIWSRGKKLTEEHKEKIRASNIGKHRITPERRAKLSASLLKTDRKGKKSPNWKGGRNATFKRYRETHRDKVKFWRSKWRERMDNVVGSHTYGEWDLLKKQFGHRCPACGRAEPEIRLTEDHIIPISKGGSDFIENIQPLCLVCNSIKGDRFIKNYESKQCKT